MGSINLNSLKSVNKISPDFTYNDLHFDIAEDTAQTNTENPSPRGKDIKIDFDTQAIRNSIINILNTTPGERFLIPEFGANLRKYLFMSVTKSVGTLIGNTILNAIEKWEPRVRVEKVQVVGRPFGSVTPKDTGKFNNILPNSSPSTENEYDVTLIVSVPTFKRRVSLLGVLSSNGFAEIRNN